MSESLYRLTFSGELLEGQHSAVVKKKLGVLLKVPPERLDKLFSGETVVIKKSVDKTTAARFQAAFKQAGGQLRVSQFTAAKPVVSVEGASNFDLAAAGSNLLAEPKVVPERNIETGHLIVAAAGSDILEEEYKRQPTEEAPDVSHISLSDETIFPPSEQLALDALVIEVQDWDVGAPGDDLLDEYPDIAVDINLEAISFELAETGSLMDQDPGETQPPPPDTSHISLTDQPDPV